MSNLPLDKIAELAKQGGRLSSDKQWVLADALATLTETEIATVAITSSRNESTLHQYARAAQRWDPIDRVEGVSFSAHRVVLSWHDPRGLLVELKTKHGSPTVRQVRQAMGLEGHPALELIERGIRKLDRKVSAQALGTVILTLGEFHEELSQGGVAFVEDEAVDEAIERYKDEDMYFVPEQHADNEPEADQHTLTADAPTGTWTPPIRTTDVSGI